MRDVKEWQGCYLVSEMKRILEGLKGERLLMEVWQKYERDKTSVYIMMKG